MNFLRFIEHFGGNISVAKSSFTFPCELALILHRKKEDCVIATSEMETFVMYISERLQRCAYCEQEFTDIYIGSVSQEGSDDLDYRFARPYGKYIGCIYGKSCPNCGFTAPDLEKTIPNRNVVTEIMDTEEYGSCCRLYPNKYIQNFYRQYLIAKGLGDTKSEITALKHAAWMADDEPGCAEIAKKMRMEAIPLLENYLLSGIADVNPEEYEHDFLILMDFYRRTGQFSSVIKLFLSVENITEPTRSSALYYQKDLAEAADDRIYDFRSVYEKYPWEEDIELKKELSDAFNLDDLLGTVSHNEPNERTNGQKLCEQYPCVKDLYFGTRDDPEQKNLLNRYFSARPFSRRYMYDILELIEENPGESIFIGQLNYFSNYLSKLEIKHYYDICRRNTV